MVPAQLRDRSRHSVRDSEEDMAQKAATDHEPGQASKTMVKEIVRDSLPDVPASSARPPPHMRA